MAGQSDVTRDHFVAASNGYYAAEGLEVDIIGGKGSAAVVKEVAAGSVTLGFADAGTLVLARGNEDVPVKMVAVVYNSAPHALIVLEESGSEHPRIWSAKPPPTLPAAPTISCSPRMRNSPASTPRPSSGFLQTSTRCPRCW